IVPPRCAIPRTDSRVSGTTSSSPSSPAYPRLMPRTSQPRLTADRTAARMTALSPGASPPPVEMAMRMERRLQGLRGQQMENLAGLGVTSQLGLLKDGLAVVHDFEPPTARRYHLDLCGGKLLTNRGRQTDGPGFVVSYRAVFDRNAHCRSLEVCVSQGSRGRRGRRGDRGEVASITSTPSTPSTTSAPIPPWTRAAGESYPAAPSARAVNPPAPEAVRSRRAPRSAHRSCRSPSPQASCPRWSRGRCTHRR